MKTRFFSWVLPLCAIITISLVACSTATKPESESEDEQEAMLQARSESDLPECDELSDGDTYYVWDVNAAYRCVKGKWIKLKMEVTPPTDTIVKMDTTVIKDTTIIKDTTKVHLCGEAEYNPQAESCYDNEDVIDGLCNSKNKGTIHEGASGQKYTCSANTKGKLGWRTVTEVEEVLNSNECTPENAGTATKFGYSNYICDAEKGWIFDYENLEEGSVTIGDRDYKTVGIGKQLWMAENLNYTDSVAHPNLKGQVSCYNDKDSLSCEKNGAFYTWTAAMDFPVEYRDSILGDRVKEVHQGICPEGWHIPSTKDWIILNDFVIGTNETDVSAGTGLKATTTWKSFNVVVDSTTMDTVSSSTGNGTNAYGFNAYATGTVKDNSGKLVSDAQGTYALFVVADETTCIDQYVLAESSISQCVDYLTPIRADLRYDEIALRFLQTSRYPRSTRMSVRCVSDEIRE